MPGSFSKSAATTKHSVYSAKGVVAAQNRKAAVIGAEVLKAGGHAVDAALATSLALGVCEPWMSGLGGGGAALLYHAESAEYQALDCGMIAPKKLKIEDYPLSDGIAGDLFSWKAVKDRRNVIGPHSIAVPGLAAGLDAMHERYGRIPLSELITPAIELAKKGLEVDWYTTLVISFAASDILSDAKAKSIFLPGGIPPVPLVDGSSSTISLHNTVQTLETLKCDGLKSFYRGDLGKSVLHDLSNLGSRIDQEDFHAYEARFMPSVELRFKETQIHAMPGLYAGHTLHHVLRQMESTPCQGDIPDENWFGALAEALKEAYKKRLAEEGHQAGSGDECTTHISVVDRNGNLVSLTQTLLSVFGSKIVLPDTGMLMNNGMMWFNPEQGQPNSLSPGKKPLSNMCPIIADSGELRLAAGASGGRRILASVTQILLFMIDFNMSLDEAFAQARIDVSGDELVSLMDSMPDNIKGHLNKLHTCEIRRPAPFPMPFACPNAVIEDKIGDWRYGMTEIAHPWADAVSESQDPDLSDHA